MGPRHGVAAGQVTTTTHTNVRTEGAPDESIQMDASNTVVDILGDSSSVRILSCSRKKVSIHYLGYRHYGSICFIL